MIDITMTAALRPTVVETTLRSLCDHLHSTAGFRLIVDVASVGDRNYSQEDIVNIVHQFFPDAVCRTVEDSIQAEALAWTWATVSSEFALQWEDDWELLEDVDLDFLVSKCPAGAGVVCFDRKEKPALTYSGYIGQYVHTSKMFALRVAGKSLGGPPALMWRRYMQEALQVMDKVTCLDLLSRTKEAQAVLRKWDIFCFLGIGGDGKLVRDIGKQWRADRNIIMKKNTARGVTWIQK